MTTPGGPLYVPSPDAFPAGTNDGENTCPLCARTWVVTPWDDYFIPACGHHAEPGQRPCESCGMAHLRACHAASLS